MKLSNSLTARCSISYPDNFLEYSILVSKMVPWNSWQLSLKNVFQNVWTAHRTPTEEIQFTAKTSLLLPDPFTHPPQLSHTYKIPSAKKYKSSKNKKCKRLFVYSLHPFSPSFVLGLPSLTAIILLLRFSASLNVFSFSPRMPPAPSTSQQFFTFFEDQDIQINPLWPQLYNKSAAKAVRCVCCMINRIA